jgi:hypothetical protein
LSGDVGLMILWPFDGEDEDANELSEESEEDKEIPAISSCFRSACTRSGIQTTLAPIPFQETCVDVISDPQPSKCVFLPGTRPRYLILIIFQRMRNWIMNPTVVSRARHPYVCFIFISHSFLLLTSGIQCYTRPPHHYCGHAGPFWNTTTGGVGMLRAPGGVRAECSNRGAV